MMGSRLACMSVIALQLGCCIGWGCRREFGKGVFLADLVKVWLSRFVRQSLTRIA